MYAFITTLRVTDKYDPHLADEERILNRLYDLSGVILLLGAALEVDTCSLCSRPGVHSATELCHSITKNMKHNVCDVKQHQYVHFCSPVCMLKTITKLTMMLY